MLYAINIDRIDGMIKWNSTISAIKRLKTSVPQGSRFVGRVVIDDDRSIRDYDKPIAVLIANGVEPMIQIQDSSSDKRMSKDEYLGKALKLYGRFGSSVKLYEVGNEINGDWLSAEINEKVEACHKEAKLRGLKTACTWFWDDSLFKAPMPTLPGLDWAMLSCYPTNRDSFKDMQEGLANTLGLLKLKTHAANVAIGEYGEDEWTTQNQTINKLPAVFDAYKDGGFYWNFQERLWITPYIEEAWKKRSSDGLGEGK